MAIKGWPILRITDSLQRLPNDPLKKVQTQVQHQSNWESPWLALAKKRPKDRSLGRFS
jgi:hypothetical protein